MVARIAVIGVRVDVASWCAIREILRANTDSAFGGHDESTQEYRCPWHQLSVAPDHTPTAPHAFTSGSDSDVQLAPDGAIGYVN